MPDHAPTNLPNVLKTNTTSSETQQLISTAMLSCNRERTRREATLPEIKLSKVQMRIKRRTPAASNSSADTLRTGSKSNLIPGSRSLTLHATACYTMQRQSRKSPYVSHPTAAPYPLCAEPTQKPNLITLNNWTYPPSASFVARFSTYYHLHNLAQFCTIPHNLTRQTLAIPIRQAPALAIPAHK